MDDSARFMSESVEIFHDIFFDHTAMISHAPMPSAIRPQRQQSSGNVAGYSSPYPNPPRAPTIKQTPFKQARRSDPLTPLQASHGNKLKMMSRMMPPPYPAGTESVDSVNRVDRVEKQPVMSKFKTVVRRTDEDMYFFEPENVPFVFPASATGLQTAFKPKPCKRALMDPAPIQELRPAKKPRVEEPLPAPDSFPPIEDDGLKPPHSYAILIGMAILRSPHRRLTLSQIYRWISDTFSFYRPDEAGWQNSIRHNLSLNKNFIKQERPKDKPGKGNYWAIEPGNEHVFMREKPSRRMMSEKVPATVRMEQEPEPKPEPEPEPEPEPPLPMAHPVSQTSATASLPPEVSSDATIPASEMPSADELDKTAGSEAGSYSPLPTDMHSSPPLPRRSDSRQHGTPPRLAGGFGSAPRRMSYGHKAVCMDDSGYISSLESSTLKQNTQTEAERRRIRRGRAEEEIARLRTSSYDSPSKGRCHSYATSSSPTNQGRRRDGQMLPPLTPATKLTAALPKPPPSASPSTNLRIHRQNMQSLVESPFRCLSALLPDSESIFQLTPGRGGMDEFDVLSDPIFGGGGGIFSVSPVRYRSAMKQQQQQQQHSPARKPRQDRSLSMDASGRDVTSSGSHRTSHVAADLMLAEHDDGRDDDTPSKMWHGLASSPTRLFLRSPNKSSSACVGVQAEDHQDKHDHYDQEVHNSLDSADDAWLLHDLCGDDDVAAGIDILGGFEKIGSSQPAPTWQKPPALGRSYTSAF